MCWRSSGTEVRRARGCAHTPSLTHKQLNGVLPLVFPSASDRTPKQKLKVKVSRQVPHLTSLWHFPSCPVSFFRNISSHTLPASPSLAPLPLLPLSPSLAPLPLPPPLQVTAEPLLALFQKYKDSKGKQAKLKTPPQLQELLDLTKEQLLVSEAAPHFPLAERGDRGGGQGRGGHVAGAAGPHQGAAAGEVGREGRGGERRGEGRVAGQ